MNEFISQCEVDDSIAIYTLVKEALAAVEIDISVVVIEHRGHTVEAVAVEVVLLQPILHVREQEVLNFALAIVEDHRVPILLIARVTRFRVVVIRAIQGVDTLVVVLHVVGVYQIHDYGNTEFVCAVNQRA